MAKAKAKAITLDVRSETKKGDAPKTEILKMAAEIQRLHRISTLLDLIEGEATSEQGKQSDKFDDFGRLGRLAEELEDERSLRNDLLKEMIMQSEPADAIDALIKLFILTSDESCCGHWQTTVFFQEIVGEVGKLDLKAAEQEYTAECKEREKQLDSIIRGLCRGLKITAADIGMESFSNLHTETDFSFDAAVLDLKRRAADLNLKLEG